MRWLLAEEMVAKKENGLAELAVEVLRQIVEKRCWQKKQVWLIKMIVESREEMLGWVNWLNKVDESVKTKI